MSSIILYNSKDSRSIIFSYQLALLTTRAEEEKKERISSKIKYTQHAARSTPPSTPITHAYMYIYTYALVYVGTHGIHTHVPTSVTHACIHNA